jgi:hypothetical protein
MNNLSEKTCPLVNKLCMLTGCTHYNQMLDGCEIAIMNYNLFQLKQHIRSLLNEVRGVGPSSPATDPGTSTGRNYPRPVR